MTRYKSFKHLLAKGLLLPAVLSFFASGCKEHADADAEMHKAAQWQKQRAQLFRTEVLPMAKKMIASGDIITRLGTDITSEMLRKMNKRDASFSHCGIAVVENDEVYIYHAIGGEFNPNQKLKKEPLASFGNAMDTKGLGIFRPKVSGEIIDRMMHTCNAWYKAEMPFDMQFNYQSEDRLYCAEFVAKCITRSMADSSWLHFTSAGTYKYVAVDNLFGIEPIAQIAKFSY